MAVAVIMAVIVAAVCVRKSRSEWAVAAQHAEMRKVGDFSTTAGSTMQSPKD